jgi:hypothetical protein
MLTYADTDELQQASNLRRHQFALSWCTSTNTDTCGTEQRRARRELTAVLAKWRGLAAAAAAAALQHSELHSLELSARVVGHKEEEVSL